MSWTAGEDVTTGQLITAARWNNYLGVGGSLEYLGTPGIWFPCVMWFDDSASTYNAVYSAGAPIYDTDDYAEMLFRIPDHFDSLVEAKIVVRPTATQANANWDIESWYGGAGEAYNAHSESDTATTYNVTDDQLYEVDISGILTGLAAGDAGVIKITCKTDPGHEAQVIGMFIKYNVG